MSLMKPMNHAKHRIDANMPILIAALAVGMAPHVMILPFWINVWCLASFTYLFAASRQNWPSPPRWLQLILAVSAFFGIVVQTQGKFGSDSGISLLCLMASLKPFEITTHRDRMITLFLAYFMVIASLFFTTSMGMTLYLFFSVIVITSLLIRINHPEFSIKSGLSLSLSITAQALPLALILFFIFPRIQGSLWGVQTKANPSTGLAETVSPGSMSGLKQNNTVAFRATFESKIPSAQSLYWRALVFQRFDGKTWTMVPHIPDADTPPPGESKIRYSVILEAHDQNWIAVLDLPAAPISRFSIHHDNTLYSKDKVTTRIQYSLTSNLMRHRENMTSWDRISLTLPVNGNPRSREFAVSLRNSSGSDKAYIDAILSMIREKDFYYTMNPPETHEDPVDTFLFETRKGYCEHYASTFAFLMRAAGIPARMVAGYLGGDVNPYGRYLIVRQSNAHVWVEVYLEGEGWVRIDPTAAVAPERIEAGAAPEGGNGLILDPARLKSNGFLSRIMKSVRYSWDALNYQWYSKIIGFDTERQRRFLDKLGLSLDTVSGIVKTMAYGFSIMAFLVFLYHIGLSLKKDRAIHPVDNAYALFLTKLSKAGIQKPAHMGPSDFAVFASRKRKDLEKDIKEICGLYIELKYAGKVTDDGMIRDFMNRVRRFKTKLG